MLGCTLLYSDPRKAAAVHAMVVDALGGPCMCEQGRRCPLLPGLEPQPVSDSLEGKTDLVA